VRWPQVCGDFAGVSSSSQQAGAIDRHYGSLQNRLSAGCACANARTKPFSQWPISLSIGDFRLRHSSSRSASIPRLPDVLSPIRTSPIFGFCADCRSCIPNLPCAKTVKYSLTSCLKSSVTRRGFKRGNDKRRICGNSTESEKQCAGTITSEFPLLKRSLARRT